MFYHGVFYIEENTRLPLQVSTTIYLCNGGTLGDHDLVLPILSPRWGEPDREQWLDDITCSGTDNVELWRSLPLCL